MVLIFGRRACFLRSPDTLSPQGGQPLAVHVKVDQCEGSAQVIVVLLQARKRTFTNPKTRFKMRKGCSTLARTLALVRFFLRCNWSTICLFLVRREVMSWACGAAWRIASPCP